MKNIWTLLQEKCIFASLFSQKTLRLDYGVMVAQQVLVLFVQVRILVVQRIFECASQLGMDNNMEKLLNGNYEKV